MQNRINPELVSLIFKKKSKTTMVKYVIGTRVRLNLALAQQEHIWFWVELEACLAWPNA